MDTKRRNRDSTPPKRSDALTAVRAELGQIRNQLAAAASTVAVCSAALDAQAADHDPDVAAVLRAYVGDVLALQVQRLNALVIGSAFGGAT